MRRFSQRNSLVTLSEINITPLLDLAFVLLIIFVITRPMLEQQLPLQLPQNMGRPDTQNIDPRDIRRVEITPNGAYWLRGQRLSLAQLEGELVLAPTIGGIAGGLVVVGPEASAGYGAVALGAAAAEAGAVGAGAAMGLSSGKSTASRQ